MLVPSNDEHTPDQRIWSMFLAHFEALSSFEKSGCPEADALPGRTLNLESDSWIGRVASCPKARARRAK
jgi:hypothetical protein